MESPSERQAQPGYLVIIAMVMILIGAGVVLFVLQEVIRIYLDIDSNNFINSISLLLTDTTFITFGEFPVVLGVGGAKVTAFIMLGILAWISIYLAATLISNGAQILMPDVYILLKNLKWRVNELKQAIKLR